jgi:hypothetical protein
LASSDLAPTRAPAAKIRRWQPFRNPAGTMLGFLSVALPSGLIINDAKLMLGQAGKHRIALPAVKQLRHEASRSPRWASTSRFR